ncbi:MAG: hypothetical protein H6737_10370 [Alphaproteobacteria bacterium]|nr:hypothetical protein [Alphaproteobacteria bacterium]
MSSKLTDAGWVERVDAGWVLVVPRRHLLVQAGLQLFAVPVLAGVLLLPLSILVDGEPVLVAIAAVGCGLLALLGIAMGAVGALRSSGISARSRVEVDVDAGVLRWDGSEIPTARIQGLVVEKGSPVTKWLVLRARLGPAGSVEDGPFAPPATTVVPLLSKLPPGLGPDAVELARELGEQLGVGVEVRGGVDRVSAIGLSPGNIAMLCYLPVQGVFLLASIGTLVASGDPVLRFHAKQSLVLFGVEMVAIASAIALGGAVMLVHIDAGAAVMGLALLGVVVARLVVRIGACFKASGVEPFVIPGLGGLVSRWVPRAP